MPTARAGAVPSAADSAEKRTGASAAEKSSCLIATSDAAPYQPDTAMGNSIAMTTRSPCTMMGLMMFDTVIHPPTWSSSRSAPGVGTRGRDTRGATSSRKGTCDSQYTTRAPTMTPTAMRASAPYGMAMSGPA
jgi:hypothetical protein